MVMDTHKLLGLAREASRTRNDISPETPDTPLPPGYEQVKVPVPAQHIATPFDKPPERVVLGEVQICRRCHGNIGKRAKELGYIPDPDLKKGKDGLFIRCRRCNGLGYMRNDGT